MNIGVFDSGIGGKAIAKQLQVDFPTDNIILVDDKKNVPYGSKTPNTIRQLTDTAIQLLLKQKCQIIVLACNTATVVAISWLRKRYPKTLFIGLEPMLKTANETTKTGVVAICATPATLSSRKYNLHKKHYQNLTILEPDCSKWAYMIEHNKVNKKIIQNTIEGLIKKDTDTIVLGCTHYHWIENDISSIVNGRAKILQPTEAISRRVLVLQKQIDHHDLDSC